MVRPAWASFGLLAGVTRAYMYGRKIYGLCISSQLLETATHSREMRLAVYGKAAVQDFSNEPRLASGRDGRKPRLKCRPTAWGVQDKLGSSAAQMSGVAVSRIDGSRIYTGLVL